MYTLYQNNTTIRIPIPADYVCAVNPNGTYCALGKQDGSIEVYDIQNRKFFHLIKEHMTRITVLAFITEDRLIA